MGFARQYFLVFLAVSVCSIYGLTHQTIRRRFKFKVIEADRVVLARRILPNRHDSARPELIQLCPMPFNYIIT